MSKFDSRFATQEQKEAIAWALETAASNLRAIAYPFYPLIGKTTTVTVVLAKARELLRRQASYWTREVIKDSSQKKETG